MVRIFLFSLEESLPKSHKTVDEIWQNSLEHMMTTNIFYDSKKIHIKVIGEESK